MRTWSLALVALAGLLGAAGVALAAVSAHGPAAQGPGGEDLQIAANFLLFHAAIVAALGLGGPRPQRGFLVAGSLLALGVVLFSGDLTVQGTTGMTLFGDAAPLGGIVMIVGWLDLAVAALLQMVRRSEAA